MNRAARRRYARAVGKKIGVDARSAARALKDDVPDITIAPQFKRSIRLPFGWRLVKS